MTLIVSRKKTSAEPTTEVFISAADASWFSGFSETEVLDLRVLFAVITEDGAYVLSYRTDRLPQRLRQQIHDLVPADPRIAPDDSCGRNPLVKLM